MRVPCLACDEDIRSWYPTIFDAHADLVLILINQGAIEVTITILQSERYSVSNLSGLCLPSAYWIAVSDQGFRILEENPLT